MRRAAVLLAAVLLAGCGEDPEEVRADYCEVVTERQAELSEIMAEESPTTLLRALPVFRDLAEEAPPDIADDWTVLIDAIEELQGALERAEVDPSTYDPGQPPDELTAEQRGAIERAAAGLLHPRTDAAFQAVDQQARDVCTTPLYR